LQHGCHLGIVNGHTPFPASIIVTLFGKSLRIVIHPKIFTDSHLPSALLKIDCWTTGFFFAIEYLLINSYHIFKNKAMIITFSPYY